MKNIIWKVCLVAMVVFSCNDKKEAFEATESDDSNSNAIQNLDSYSELDKMEPPNWWVGFKNDTLQLFVKAKNISQAEVEMNYPGVELLDVHKADSPNYLFLDLIISASAKPGNFVIKFKIDEKTYAYDYELKSRQTSSEDYIGFNSSDAIYLITPDRFANGNPKNDVIPTLKETRLDRKDDYARHGGDIEGIINHLDYIEDMGFTAIWSSPLLINDMPRASYHGYAITDYYRVDPRFGSLEDYKNLSQEAEKRGIKLIMDMVANHCGSEHWWMKDLPFSDWVNAQEAYENGEDLPTSNHRRTTNQDLYASQIDSEAMTEGWFVPSMPDLNQSNPFLAKYIIQNSIWWIETLKLGGIRQDTYPYPDKQFMSDWAGAIMDEYPNFNIVGEEWSYNPLIAGYWQSGQKTPDNYKSNLRSSMDFPMQQTIVDALNEDETWGTGLVKMYEGLANDFYYPRPLDMMIFPDNHDMDRIFTQLKENPKHTKMALAYILTMPRTPQVYYGTEILMQNTAKPGDHGLIRTDFPGGWEGDTVNAFQNLGLSEEQQDFKDFLKTLLNFRKQSQAIHRGKTIHFAPNDGMYSIFRQHEDEAVLLLINKNNEGKTLGLDRYSELELENYKWFDVLTSNTVQLSNEWEVKPGVNMITTKLP